MKNFKSRNGLIAGFTFIEIALSVAMLGTILTAVLMLQDMVLQQVMRFSGQLQRVFLVRNELQQLTFSVMQQQGKKDEKSEQKQGEKQEKKIESPSTMIRITQHREQKESSLGKMKTITAYRATAEWETMHGLQQETLVSLVYTGTEAQKK